MELYVGGKVSPTPDFSSVNSITSGKLYKGMQCNTRCQLVNRLLYSGAIALKKGKEIRVSTPAENRVRISSVSKGFDQFESSFANHTHE